MTPSESLQRYYSLHSRIYDATRWTFLFGRARLLHEIGLRFSPTRILEVGCGTGANLLHLARLFPLARLTGIDTSPAMLGVARRKLRSFGDRIDLREGYYGSSPRMDPAPDLICVSYCLSMINPGVEEAIAAAVADLAPGGCLAVVDFHGSRHRWFRRWMQVNHVRMEEHLLPVLKSRFSSDLTSVRTVYGGLWQYFLFLGRLQTDAAVDGTGRALPDSERPINRHQAPARPSEPRPATIQAVVRKNSRKPAPEFTESLASMTPTYPR